MSVWEQGAATQASGREHELGHSHAVGRTLVVDETLRDGLQSPSVRSPEAKDAIELLHAMAAIGVDVVSIGLPAASRRAVDDASALLGEIAAAKLPLIATAAARTTARDVEAIAEVSQRAGAPLEVYAFIGSSPIRHFSEGWSQEFLTKCIREAAEAARKAGLPFCLVTEDTTRAHPKMLTALWDTAIDAGVARLCLCDTVGHAEPRGVEALVAFVRCYLDARGAGEVELDWHGHNDRGLGLGNALYAARCGVERIHGTALGVGERVGNVAMEPLIHNLALDKRRRPASLESLRRYSDLASRALGWPISEFAALVGERSRGLDQARAAAPVFGRTIVEPAISARDARRAHAREPRRLALRVNGDPIEALALPSRTLLELLRYDLDLVGTRQGCDKGDCGACTVLVDGEPVLSCLTLAHHAEGREVTTVESLSGPPRLDPLLDAFDRLGAGQCGFCTPGMLMTAEGLLRKRGCREGSGACPSRDEIRTAISGNLCRCTGYGPIVSAIELAAKIHAGAEPAGVGLPGAHVPPALPPFERRAKPEKASGSEGAASPEKQT